MLPVTFKIFFRTPEGEVVFAFNWCRDAASGIARAKREAGDFGYQFSEVWAEPVGE